MIPVDKYRSDEELLQLYCKSGKLIYLTDLYKRYMPLVYGVALKYLKKPEDAQDAVMQLFENTVEKAKSTKIEVFKSWLYTCTRNYCLMELRKKTWNVSLNLDHSFMDFCEDLHLEFDGENEEREKAVRECMEELPEKQRICINHFFFDKLSYKEVEMRTGFSSKNVKSFIQNGKRNLKLCINRKGLGVYDREQ